MRVGLAIGALVMAAASCGHSGGPDVAVGPTATARDTTTSGGFPTVTAVAGDTAANTEAQRLLDAAVPPPSARRVERVPGGLLDGPASLQACRPLIDLSRTWIVPGTPASVEAYLLSHPPQGMHVAAQTSLSPVPDRANGVYPVAEVWYREVGPSVILDTLDFSFTQLGAGQVGLRVDAQVIPPDAQCTRSGGAAMGAG